MNLQVKFVSVAIQCHYTGVPNMCIYASKSSNTIQRTKKVKTYRAQERLQWLLSTYELSSFAWIIATILTEICSA